MKKNIFITALAVIMAVSASCTAPSDTVESGKDSVTEQTILVKREKLIFCDYKTADDYILAEKDKYAVRFNAESPLHSFDLHAFSGEGMCSAVITLYKWTDDYETTVNSKPFDKYTLGPLSKKDIGAVQAMSFSSIKTPPAGEYLLLISFSNPTSLLLMGEKTEDAKKNGIICYKNGVEYDKTPCMTMAYHMS